MATPEDRLPGGPAPDAQPQRAGDDAQGVPCRAEDCLFHDGMTNCALKPSEIQIDENAYCETYEPEERAPATPPQGGPMQRPAPQPSPMSPQRPRVPPA